MSDKFGLEVVVGGLVDEGLVAGKGVVTLSNCTWKLERIFWIKVGKVGNSVSIRGFQTWSLFCVVVEGGSVVAVTICRDANGVGK